MSDYIELQKRINKVLGKKIFFIVGTMKSGTTWLQLILDSHPDVSCRGEGHFTDILATNLAKSFEDYNARISNIYNNRIFNEIPGYPTLQRDHYTFVLRSTICLLLYDQMDGRNVRAIGEKTPNHTRALHFLSQLFPAAKFIHLIRDGRDTAVSAWFHFLRINPNGLPDQAGSFSEFIEKFAHQWASDIKEARKYGAQNPDSYREYRYESLHDTGDAVIREILEFLDIDSADSVVRGCLESASFDRLSSGRKPGHENKGSHFRKGVVGDWKNHFSSHDAGRFSKVAGNMLDRLGYGS